MKKTLLVILIIFTLFSRLYGLSKLPPALYQDETAIGYNAYSILKTNKDEWGQKFPVYFKSFGDYKLPFYIYTTAVFIKLLGLKEIAVRLPSALAGSIAVFVFFLLVKTLTRNFYFGLIAGFLLSINPQHIFFSRAGFEVNFSLTLILAGVYLFTIFTKNHRSTLLFLSTILFTLATYTYNVSRIVSPLVLSYLLLKHKNKVLSVEKKKLAIIVALNLALLYPFISVFFSPLGVKTAKGEVIFSSPYALAENVKFRAYLLEFFPPLFVKLFFNKLAFVLHKYAQNLAAIISFDFFFVKGTQHPTQGIGNIGYFHLFELPFILFGFYTVFKRKIKGMDIFTAWFLIAYFTLALSRQVPHATRGYFLIIPLLFFETAGWLEAFKLLKNLKKFYYVCFSAFVLLFIAYNLLYFTLSYVYIFPREKAAAWGVAQKELALYIKENYNKYDKILIDKKAPLSYTTLTFYLKLDPNKFLNTVEREKSGDLYYAKKFDKFEIRDINLDKDLKGNVLIVLDGLAQPLQEYVVKTIKLPRRHVALSLQDNIVQWPEEKTDFILVERKNN